MPYVFSQAITATVAETGGSPQDTLAEVASATGASKEAASPSVPAAKAGSLTTRTDANTGVLTMDAGHGFATSDVVDVFWSGGSRRAMTATVAGNAVTVDGGSGDDLPAVSTAVTAMKPVEVPFVVDGDEAVGLAVYSPVAGYAVFVDDAAAEIAAATYQLDAGEGKSWVSGKGTNPLAGAVTSLVKFSHADATAAQTPKAVAVFN